MRWLGARVALPEDDYLVLISQVAYMVSSLEWTILGDLPGLAQYLPDDLTTSVLAGKSTGQFAGALSKPVDEIASPSTGMPIWPETYSKAFAVHCVKAGVPVIRLHDVRHTAATMLLDGGTTPSATAKWLGHDPAITLRVYGHLYDDALASAGNALLCRSQGGGE